LLEYHNLGRALDVCTKAQLLIGMCMDNRKHLRIPDNFAFIIRAGKNKNWGISCWAQPFQG
jgi:carbonic anhydrase